MLLKSKVVRSVRFPIDSGISVNLLPLKSKVMRSVRFSIDSGKTVNLLLLKSKVVLRIDVLGTCTTLL